MWSRLCSRVNIVNQRYREEAGRKCGDPPQRVRGGFIDHPGSPYSPSGSAPRYRASIANWRPGHEFLSLEWSWADYFLLQWAYLDRFRPADEWGSAGGHGETTRNSPFIGAVFWLTPSFRIVWIPSIVVFWFPQKCHFIVANGAHIRSDNYSEIDSFHGEVSRLVNPKNVAYLG